MTESTKRPRFTIGPGGVPAERDQPKQPQRRPASAVVIIHGPGKELFKHNVPPST